MQFNRDKHSRQRLQAAILKPETIEHTCPVAFRRLQGFNEVEEKLFIQPLSTAGAVRIIHIRFIIQ